MFEVEKATNEDLKLSIENRVPTTSEFFTASVKEAFVEGTILGPGIIENNIEKAENKKYGYDMFNPGKDSLTRNNYPTLSKDEWTNSEFYRPGMKYREGITEVRARIEAENYDDSQYRKYLIGKGSNTIGRKALGFGAAMIGSLPDPINLVPFANISTKSVVAVKAARNLKNASQVTNAMKIGSAVVDGAAGNLATSVATRPYWDERGIESTWKDYVFDTMVGGVLGGSLSSIGVGISQVSKKITMKNKDILARQIEKDMLDLETTGKISEEKVRGYSEAERDLFSMLDVQESKQLKYIEKKLKDSGMSEIDVKSSVAPVVAHAKAFSKYYGEDFDSFLKNRVLKDVDVNSNLKGDYLQSDIRRKEGVQYRAKRSETPDDFEITEINNLDKYNLKSEVDFRNEISHYFRRRVVKNKDVGKNIEINENTLGKFNSVIFKNTRLNNKNKYSLINILPKLDEVLEKAVWLESATDLKSKNRGEFRYLFSEVKVNGKNQLVEFQVTSKNGKYKLYNWKIAELAPSAANRAKNADWALTPEANNIVSELERKFNIAKQNNKYFQKDTDTKARGSVKFLKNGENVISLFSSADKSTFLHETGHIFLRNLQDLALMSDSPKTVAQDYKVIKNWLGMKGDKISRSQHEKFARGFEKYLREGKAPSSSLARAFESFKEWLTQIYKHAEDLNSDITDEVRSVFDNMMGGSDFDVDPLLFVKKMDEDLANKKYSEFDIVEFEDLVNADSLSEIDKAIYKQVQKDVELTELKIKKIEEVEEAFTLFQGDKDEMESFLSDEFGMTREEMEQIMSEIESLGKLQEIEMFNSQFSDFKKTLLKDNVTSKSELNNLRRGITDKGIIKSELAKNLEEELKYIKHDNPVFGQRIKNHLIDYAELNNINLSIDEINLATKYHAAKIINKKMKNELKEQTFIQKRRAIQTLIAKNKNLSDIQKMIDGGANPDEAILAILEGRAELRHIGGSGNSVDARRMAIEGYYVNEMEKRVNSISPSIFKRLSEEPEFNGNVIDEFWNLENKKVKGSSTGDNEAYQLAKTLKDLADENRERLNASGSDVGHLKNWAPQSHSKDKLISYTSKKWIDKLLNENMLDLERTFGVSRLDEKNSKYVREQLAQIYNRLALGHAEDVGEELGLDIVDQTIKTEKETSGITTRNIAKRHDHSRALFFKNSEAQVKYNKEFGDKNIVVGINDYLMRGARTLALTEKLGPNPEYTINLMVKEIKDSITSGERLIELDDAGKDKVLAKLPSPVEIAKREKQIGKAIKIALGEHLRAEDNGLANVSGIVRSIQTASKLGGATLSQMADLTNATNELAIMRDTTLLDQFIGKIKSISKFSSPEEKKIIERLGTITDGILSQNMNRWSVDEGGNHVMHNINNFMFRINGMHALTNKFKASHGLAITSDLADYSSKSFKDLPLGYQEALKQYSKIDGIRWDVLRKAPVDSAKDSFYLTPEAIKAIRDEDFEILIPNKFKNNKRPTSKNVKLWESSRQKFIEQARRELETDYRIFLIESTRNAVLEPDARTTRWTTQGHSRGTPAGEAIRFFMQFKSFAFTQAHRVVKGKRYRRAGREVDYSNTAQYAATALLLGYVSMTMKDLAKGREPKDPKMYSTWIESAAQSGGAGIIGDVVFNSNNRFGGSAMASFMGPTFASIDQMMDIKGKIQQSSKNNIGDAAKDIGGATMNFVKSHIPMQSLWYTRELTNHLVWYHLKEMLSPGYTRRMERRMKRESNQEFFVSPSKAWGY